MLNITAVERAKDDRKTRRRGWYALATGLNTAFVISYLICKPPSHTLSLTTRLVAPIIFIVVASIAGIFGTWMMLPTGEHDQLRTLSRIGLRGWLFLPTIALFLHQGSPLAPLIAIISAILIAISIHRQTATTPNPTPDTHHPTTKPLHHRNPNLPILLATARPIPLPLRSLCCRHTKRDRTRHPTARNLDTSRHSTNHRSPTNNRNQQPATNRALLPHRHGPPLRIPRAISHRQHLARPLPRLGRNPS